MLITNNYVMLNNPKTGSSFVRKAVKELYKRKKYKNLFYSIFRKSSIYNMEFTELILPNIKMHNRKDDQHGTFVQIPQQYINRTVVTVIRNPFTRFLSNYKFRSWLIHSEYKKSEFVKQFPTYPDTSIDEYIKINSLDRDIRMGKIDNKQNIGSQTIQFIQMFFNDPQKTLININDDYIYSGHYKDDIGNITYIRQEDLNNELIEFLVSQGERRSDLEFINKMKKINVSHLKNAKEDSIWTEKSIQYVQESERYLFTILKDLNIDYTVPKHIFKEE